MRRDMQEVLERWGRWAASEEYCSMVDWPRFSVIPYGQSDPCLPKCSDEDGAAIDTCIAHMSLVCEREDLLILGQRFVGGHSARCIAEAMEIGRARVNTSLRASEAFVEGCLMMLNIRLDMDLEIKLSKRVVACHKSMLFS